MASLRRQKDELTFWSDLAKILYQLNGHKFRAAVLAAWKNRGQVHRDASQLSISDDRCIVSIVDRLRTCSPICGQYECQHLIKPTPAPKQACESIDPTCSQAHEHRL